MSLSTQHRPCLRGGILLVTVLATALGCATLGGSSDQDDPAQYVGDPAAATLDFGTTAEENFRRGTEALEKRAYSDAVFYFTYLRNKFPYSQYAAKADLLIGDSHFENEDYLSAIDAYQRFQELHPSHPQVPYALFRVGVSHFRHAPGDWWLLPPSYEKDLTSVKQAVDVLETFLRAYPESEYALEAQKVVAQCHRRMAEHELYVARFYAKRDRHTAAITRLEGILRSYPDSGLGDEVLLALGKSHLALDQDAQAREAFQRLVEGYPESPLRRDALAELAQLQNHPHAP